MNPLELVGSAILASGWKLLAIYGLIRLIRWGGKIIRVFK